MDKTQYLQRQAAISVSGKRPKSMRDRRKRREKDAKKSWQRDGGW